MKKTTLIIVIIFFINNIKCNNFYGMKNYLDILKNNSDKLGIATKNFATSFWLESCNNIYKYLKNDMNENYLNHPILQNTMVISGYHVEHQFEECLLKECLNQDLKNRNKH